MSTSIVHNENKSDELTQPDRLQSGPTFTPRFDIWETEEGLVLCGDLPGVASEDLDIQFENRQLTIRGKVQPREGDRKMVHQEYRVGDYYRSFAIGQSIDADRISAELNAGVLTLHLPTAESAKPRRIDVKAS